MLLLHIQIKKSPMEITPPPTRFGSGIERLKAVFLVRPLKVLTPLFDAPSPSMPSDSHFYNNISSRAGRFKRSFTFSVFITITIHS